MNGGYPIHQTFYRFFKNLRLCQALPGTEVSHEELVLVYGDVPVSVVLFDQGDDSLDQSEESGDECPEEQEIQDTGQPFARVEPVDSEVSDQDSDYAVSDLVDGLLHVPQGMG